MKRFRKLVFAVGAIAAAQFSQPAFALTQCQGLVQRIWAGDGGYLWIHLTNGGAAAIAPSDPNREAVTAMAISALVGGRQVIIRYAADGVDCAYFGRLDFVGMYLL